MYSLIMQFKTSHCSQVYVPPIPVCCQTGLAAEPIWRWWQRGKFLPQLWCNLGHQVRSGKRQFQEEEKENDEILAKEDEQFILVLLRPSKDRNFSVILHGRESWSLTPREEHRLRVFENMVLWRIFEPERDEVTRGWRKLHDELRNLYSSSCRIIRMITARKMRETGRIARIGSCQMRTECCLEHLKGPRHRWEDGISRMRVCTGFLSLSTGTPCRTFSFHKRREISWSVVRLSLLKNDSAPYVPKLFQLRVL
jgi:hypothetical protein